MSVLGTHQAHCEVSVAERSIERLTDECNALRGDLQRQEVLVAQRDGAIASLRDEACTQWASGWLTFQRRVASAFSSLDLNFDIPSGCQFYLFLSTLGFEPEIYVMSFLVLILNEYPIFNSFVLPLIVFFGQLCLS